MEERFLFFLHEGCGLLAFDSLGEAGQVFDERCVPLRRWRKVAVPGLGNARRARRLGTARQVILLLRLEDEGRLRLTGWVMREGREDCFFL